MSVSIRHILDDNERAFAVILRNNKHLEALEDRLVSAVEVNEIEACMREAGKENCVNGYRHYVGISLLRETIGRGLLMVSKSVATSILRHSYTLVVLRRDVDRLRKTHDQVQRRNFQGRTN